MDDRVSNYPVSTFASTALLFFGSGLATTLLLAAKPLESLVGVAIAAVGASMMLWRWRRRKLARLLVLHGQAVEALVTGVRASALFQVNGRSPYHVEAQWLDPATREVRTFKSWSLWYDPKVFIKHEHVVVYIDPQRSDRYYMDIASLPEFDGP
ncbi:MAG TPA: hypothetical protein VIT90_18430 [Lysobacter sp.]